MHTNTVSPAPGARLARRAQPAGLPHPGLPTAVVVVIALLGAFGIGLPGCSSAHAQESAPAPEAVPHAVTGWKFTLAPYLWVPAVSGDATIGGFKSDVNVTQRDAFEALGDLEAGLSLHFEAKYEKWSLFGDMMYFKLESDATGPEGGTLRTRFEEGIFEIGAAYRVLDRPLDEAGTMNLIVEPLAGVRIYYIDGRIHSDALARTEERDQTWADVFGGVRGAVSFLSGKVSVFGRFDIGAGGSDLAWNALTGVDLRLAEWCSLIGGYRWLSIDYSTGEGMTRFNYDLLSQGPFMAFEFRF